MKQLTVKELKSKLDEDELDLSMNELSSVPVKELAGVPKATKLDLSCNRLEILPQDFVSLVHLIRLDLSQNQLQFLPDNFGQLRNLEHLDLYKNQLQTVPVSFFQLKKLKWLDLKDNQLEPRLTKIVGDCLDAKQCQFAASNIVNYMRKVQAEQERDRQKSLAEKRAVEAEAKKKAEEEMKQQQQTAKARKKEKKLKPKTIENGPKTVEKQEEKTEPLRRRPEKKPMEKKKPSSPGLLANIISCLWWVAKTGAFLCVVALIASLFLGSLLYYNCTSKPAVIPGSEPLCRDIYHFSATGTLPPESLSNLQLASKGIWSAFHARLTYVLESLAKLDYGRMFWDLVEALRKSGEELWKDAKPILEMVWGQIRMGAKWLLLSMADAGDWLWSTSQQFVDDLPLYWEKIKHYWNNMK